MNDLGRDFGTIILIVGIVWHVGEKLFSFGKLPGDYVVKKENFRFFFPIETLIKLSLVVSLIYYIINSFRS